MSNLTPEQKLKATASVINELKTIKAEIDEHDAKESKHHKEDGLYDARMRDIEREYGL